MLLRVLLLSIALFGITNSVYANQPPQEVEDEYDFSWLDPEKKIYVVQNRKYTKKNRLELALSGGIGIGEPYRTRRTLLPRAMYYINESWGVSGFMLFNQNEENGNVAALRLVSGRIPAVRDIQNYSGGSVMWIPFYGKINMFNKIFYLDWHLEAGVGGAASEIDLNTTFGNPANLSETNYFSFHWGTGQKFFITRNWAARLDYLAIFYKAPTGVDGSITSGPGAVEETYDNHFVTLGVSYTF